MKNPNLIIREFRKILTADAKKRFIQSIVYFIITALGWVGFIFATKWIGASTGQPNTEIVPYVFAIMGYIFLCLILIDLFVVIVFEFVLSIIDIIKGYKISIATLIINVLAFGGIILSAALLLR